MTEVGRIDLITKDGEVKIEIRKRLLGLVFTVD